MAAYQNSVPLKNEIISLEINRGGTTKFVRVFDQRKRVEEGNKKKISCKYAKACGYRPVSSFKKTITIS